jgi:hypothetical protein
MKAKLATITPRVSRVVVGTHPPIIVALTAKADNGILAEGLLVAKDADGKIVAYNPAGAAPLNVLKGVLTQELDTAEDTSATVLRHGTVRGASLTVGGVAADADDFEALVAVGIYAA